MKLVTAEQMKGLEKAAVVDYGVPGLLLMEHAGKALAVKCLEFIHTDDCHKRIWIFVGKGNNGGDGLVAARHLINCEQDVRVILLCNPWNFRGDAKLNYEMLQKLRPEMMTHMEDLDLKKLKHELHDQDLVIDSIYGTGFKGVAMGMDGEVIRCLMNHRGIVISADLPSGMEANSGMVSGPCINADYTLSFGLPKLGLYRDPDHPHCGLIEVVDIGLPRDLTESKALKVELLNEAGVAEQIPIRKRNSHKGTYGHVLIVGGSTGMTGAVALACRGALASGAGLVTAGVPASLHDVMETKLTEAMTKPLPEIQPGDFSQDAGGIIFDFLSKASVLVLGPGMGRHRSGKELVNELLPRVTVPMVIDADGLNLVAEILKERPDFFIRLSSATVLTPHSGEMARLTGLSIEEIEAKRIAVAAQYAQSWQCIIVLKGAYTVVAAPDGRVYLNTTGNAGMATGGSGDVLAGMIGSLIGQSIEPIDAATTAVYLHGKSGEYAAEYGLESVCASHLIENLPRAFHDIRKP